LSPTPGHERLFRTLEALEEHLIPALDAVEDALDWEPTDADLADYRA
jgi:hypothetical protein